MEIIVKNAHVNLIMHPRLIDLVNKKWERFARRIFFRRFLITLSYLFIFLLTTILDQTRIETVIKSTRKFELNYIFIIYFRTKGRGKMK